MTPFAIPRSAPQIRHQYARPGQQVLYPATLELIHTEVRRQYYLSAVAIVRTDVTPESWRAFELTVLDDVSIEEAAGILCRSAGSIYAIRSRVMRRLREAVRELEAME